MLVARGHQKSGPQSFTHFDPSEYRRSQYQEADSSETKILLSFLGTVRLDSSNETVEVVGENEQLDHFSEQMWKGRIQRATRWVKSKANKRLVQSA